MSKDGIKHTTCTLKHISADSVLVTTTHDGAPVRPTRANCHHDRAASSWAAQAGVTSRCLILPERAILPPPPTPRPW